ncbi:MAG: hypothetical protein J0L99_03035 [Chitinophagales bacterium]|nr:hypothetical protein [Chitinophagales bacterium]
MTSTCIKPPNAIPTNDNRPKVFLGGSIEMGKAEHWQAELEVKLSEHNVLLLNPRRDDWDSSWLQISTDINLRTQVEWELDALESADFIIMYFAPNTMSPISLLELGLHARSNKLLVVCPEGFWRKGNVDIVCEKYNIRQFETLEVLVEALKNEL